MGISNGLSQEELFAFIRQHRNWGRWGEHDEKGALNLIDENKRLVALRSVRSGRVFSLSAPYAKTPGFDNPSPNGHFVYRSSHGGARSWLPPDSEEGTSGDFLSLRSHGWLDTHVDALCHVWNTDGMWGGRNPDEEIESQGVKWGGIDKWQEGVVTRGVLLDIPRHRGVPYVEQGEPVHGEELFEVARAQGVGVQPGDAVVIYCGRERFCHDNGPYGGLGVSAHPGLHASSLMFFRQHDVSVIAWDMRDMIPSGYSLTLPVHAAVYAFGVAVIDNAHLETLAEACQAAGQWEFLFFMAPLVIEGGTGSPVNPIVIL
jgi:kynurenine formamidase